MNELEALIKAVNFVHKTNCLKTGRDTKLINARFHLILLAIYYDIETFKSLAIKLGYSRNNIYKAYHKASQYCESVPGFDEKLEEVNAKFKDLIKKT